MELITKIHDKIAAPLALMLVVFAAIAPYAVLNVATRPDTISIVTELPQRKGVVTIWDAIDNDVGLGDSPDWYVDHEANIRPYATTPNTFYNTQVFTADDAVCLAKNIYFEARGESVKGQIAVALVTLNRVKDRRYPNTVCGVVYDNKQFSWYNNGMPDYPENHIVYERIALMASAMLSTETKLVDFTYGATHYHADYVAPYWSEYMVRKVKIDTHIFYYEPPNAEMLTSL